MLWQSAGLLNTTWFLVASGVCVTGSGAAWVIGAWAVPRFNRPRFIVPPMYRRDDGIPAARRRAAGKRH